MKIKDYTLWEILLILTFSNKKFDPNKAQFCTRFRRINFFLSHSSLEDKEKLHFDAQLKAAEKLYT